MWSEGGVFVLRGGDMEIAVLQPRGTRQSVGGNVPRLKDLSRNE